MRVLFVLFAVFALLATTTFQGVESFNVPPKGGMCVIGAQGDCYRCECSRGYNCRKGKCV